MKTLYLKDIVSKVGEEVEILGWIGYKRQTKNFFFLDVVDSTGKVQVFCQGIDDIYKREQSVRVLGKVVERKGTIEIIAKDVQILGDVKFQMSPYPREKFDVFGTQYVDYVQKNRHLFVRNPRVMAALKARALVMIAVHEWFDSNGFYEVTAPILTPILLYDTETGIPVKVNNQDVFLTQCVGFYLEAAVHGLEKVYNIGPSFRGMESISKRHLTEYWHIKAELAFCPFEEFFGVVEDLVSFVTRVVGENPETEAIAKELKTGGYCMDALTPPFPRITYSDAVKLLKENGYDVEFGKSINDIGEDFLADYFKSPVWITYNARSIEGFPYKIIKDDPELTLTADLIATRGFGEILGIADKIENRKELEYRLKEKGKDTNPKYEWFKQLRDYGTIQHCGLGMGLERLVRWLFQLPHVREASAFPRSMGREIYP